MPLFNEAGDSDALKETLGAGAVVLRGFANEQASALIKDVNNVVKSSPFRHQVTPGGFRMSVAMSNCGPLGWVTDERGYRYDSIDPVSGMPWPSMPVRFSHLASDAAAAAEGSTTTNRMPA